MSADAGERIDETLQQILEELRRFNRREDERDAKAQASRQRFDNL